MVHVSCLPAGVGGGWRAAKGKAGKRQPGGDRPQRAVLLLVHSQAAAARGRNHFLPPLVSWYTCLGDSFLGGGGAYSELAEHGEPARGRGAV